MEQNLLEVRPIRKERWHGKTGKESFTRPHRIRALVDPSTYRFSTGLSENDIEHLDKIGHNYDLSDNYDVGVPHPFWDTNLGVVKLENNSMFFNKRLPLDYIRVKMMEASNFVANSMKEYEKGLFPEATHVIYNEEAEIKDLASKQNKRTDTFIKIRDINKERQAEIIFNLTGKDLRGKSDDFFAHEFQKAADKDLTGLIAYIDKDAAEVSLETLVKMSIANNILVKNGPKISYMEGTLGNSVTEVIEYLSKPGNSEMVLTLKAKLPK